MPRLEHGYCLDDVARGLVVLSREPDLPAELSALAEGYLAFVAYAQGEDGRFHNRLGPDEPGLGDWWGRALWRLGTAAARCPVPSIRRITLECFERGAHHRPPSVGSMTFAALGAAEVLDDGLLLLDWLLSVESKDFHLSPVPASGWFLGEPRPAFDQQPIEAAAMADACARAYRCTDDPAWLAGVHRSIAWFNGDNDLGSPMRDEQTGGGFAGLTPRGPNLNQGAESTLALLSTLQRLRTLLRSAA